MIPQGPLGNFISSLRLYGFHFLRSVYAEVYFIGSYNIGNMLEFCMVL